MLIHPLSIKNIEFVDFEVLAQSPALVWPVNHHMLIYFISNRYTSTTYCLAKINNKTNKVESVFHSPFSFLSALHTAFPS